MKRAEQLQKLSHEHHTSLVMAKTISNIAEEGSDEELEAAIVKVKNYYDDELEEHFQHEERTIFAPIFQQYREHIGIATELLKEHGFIRLLVPKLNNEQEIDVIRKELKDFALVLKSHTRTEERELFPMIESIFTDEQLDAVLNFIPLD